MLFNEHHALPLIFAQSCINTKQDLVQLPTAMIVTATHCISGAQWLAHYPNNPPQSQAVMVPFKLIGCLLKQEPPLETTAPSWL
jgi:hypothetical protein